MAEAAVPVPACAVERGLAEEMRLHLEMKAQALGGDEESRYRARRGFGNTMLVRESSRAVWMWRPLEELAQESAGRSRLAAAALLAGFIPARRAAKIDPMVALRYE